MLVPILNTTDRSGGAGIAAFRQSEALEKAGVIAPVLCLHRRFNDARSFRYRLRTSEHSRTLHLHREAVQRVQQRFVNHNRSSRSKTIFSAPWAGGYLIGDNPLVAAAPVVHMHWVNHFLDLHSIDELAAGGRPLVWTLHDEWLFTAGCHYTSGCEQWGEGCSDCPQLLSDPYRLVSHWFAQKAEQLARTSVTVVTPSRWLAERAQQSALLRDKRVEVIRNTFDGTTFAPPDPQARSEYRHQHGFSDDTVVLCFGAQTLRDVRKGFGLLVEALKALDGVANVGLLVFGSRSDALEQLAARMRIAYVGELHDSAEIARVLAASDCFVMPSLEENYPNVIIEALLCGTPVIAYACGGIPEQVVHRENGLLVSPVGDAKALGEALAAFVGDPALRRGVRAFDREAIAQRHSHDEIAHQLLALYRSIAPDFDAPLDPGIATYLQEQARRSGPARDFLALPSHRSSGESEWIEALVGDEMDELRRQHDQAQRAQRDRQYLGFFDAVHHFGRQAEGPRFLNYGWSAPEERGTWSCERSAGIAAWLPQGANAITLRITASCRGTSQIVALRIGQESVARIRLSGTRSAHAVRLELPATARAGGIVQIHLDFPHAQPEPGGSRLLGMFLHELGAEIHGAAATTP